VNSKDQAHQEGLNNIDRGLQLYRQLIGTPQELADQNRDESLERFAIDNERLLVLGEANDSRKQEIEMLRTEIDALNSAYERLDLATKKVNWDTYRQELDARQSAIRTIESAISEAESEIKQLKFANQRFHLTQEFKSGQNGGGNTNNSELEKAADEAKLAYTQRFYHPEPNPTPEILTKQSGRPIPAETIDKASKLFSAVPQPLSTLQLAVAIKRVYDEHDILVEGLFFNDRTLSASAMVKVLLDPLIYPEYKSQPDKMVALLTKVKIAGFTENDIRSALHDHYRISDREVDLLLGREPITVKWQGTYYTDCDHWGAYFSPLIITAEGKLLIANTAVDYSYDERTDELNIKHFETADSNTSGKITFVMKEGCRSFNGYLYPRIGDGAAGFRGENRPFTKWQGVYQTGTDYWGEYFSPLIIKESGEVLIKGVSIDHSFNESSDKLIINRTPVGEAIPAGEITFSMEEGQPVFHGVLFPQIGDGPGSYWGSIPVAKWKGEYQTGTDYWGAYFSPLVIREDGLILIKDVPIKYRFDLKTDTLKIYETKIGTAVPSGEIRFTHKDGNPEFSGVLFPQIGDGPGNYWGHANR
jgi:hypothetical protein